MNGEPMDEDTFQTIVRARIDAAAAYADGDLATARERATRYYRGDVSDDLPQIEGRSGVVSRDLRDTVLAILPSLIRMFVGSEKVVEFDPVGPEDEQAAKQATDYANYVFRKANNGFLILHSAFKDALLQRTGLVKVWWDETATVDAEKFTGIDPAALAMFQQDPSAELLDVTQDETGASFTLKRTTRKGRVRVEAMPPEELIIARDARSFERPSLIGQRTVKTVSDLVAMGYDFDEMLALSGDVAETEEDEARRFDGSYSDDEALDPAMREVEYVEAYLLVDFDGDGIAELRKVCMAGEVRKVLHHEIVSDHPFADFCPEPEPHTAIGLSLFDCLDDIQLIRTQLLRLGLDGLASTVTPRLGYLEGRVNLKQLVDARPGGLVGMQTPDSVFPLAKDAGAPAMAMDAYRQMGELRQERTGQNAASMGLSPDLLQSTSRIAANEMVQQAQSRVEMIARVFAETGMRRIFRLILRLSSRYQDRETVTRLRNQWVAVDPRAWNADMDVSVNVGLGTGNTEERAVFLQGILQIQQQVMQQGGPQNPWFNAEKVRNAIEDLCEVGGRLASRYVVTQDEWAQLQQQQAQKPPQPPKPSPEEMLAQVQAQSIQQDAQNKREKLQFDQVMERMRDDRERDKTEAGVILDCLKANIDPAMVLGYLRQHRAAELSGG